MKKTVDSIKLWRLKSILTVFLSLLALSVSAPGIKFVYISIPESVDAYARQTGHWDYETIARNWNGSGKLTLDYWEKVKANL